MELSITLDSWGTFFLVLVRVAAMIMVAPALGARSVPAQVKVGLSLLLALLVTPLQAMAAPQFSSWLSVLLAVSREVLVGLLLGFAAVLVFSAVRMTAQLIGVQIGFGFSGTVDPFSNEGSSFLESFYYLVALLVFLNLGGHYALITGISNSFDLVPLGQFGPSALTSERLIVLSSVTIAAAVRLAMPVLGTLLLTDAAMALIIRTIPQMNIFAVGLPVKMVVGILALVALMPATAAGFGDTTRSVAAAVNGMLR